MKAEVIRIGGASGFWGETSVSVPQLLAAGGLDYIVFDYLAEITMSIMARARAADPARGYAVDFVSGVLKPHLSTLAEQKVRVISNAGGVNPEACGQAIRELVKGLGLDLKVAVVIGDDLLERSEAFAEADTREMFSGVPFPPREQLASVNAYLGAWPIAAALGDGADIVVTGRVADSAVTLGACIHEFGWSPTNLDALAGASVAGHILECSTQATGGNFTDWELVADSLVDIGYPVVEIEPDGSFVCTKPEGTGGLVSRGTVSEQLLYEIGDPQAYLLPDVVCDFTRVEVSEVGADRVRVSGAKGYAPTDSYKVSATYVDGFRGGELLMFYGADADRKAKVFAEVALQRASRRLEAMGLAPYSETLIETFGDESHYGDSRRVQGSREVTVKVAVKHADQKAVALFQREAIGTALGSPPGLTVYAGGRPKPSPVVRLFSFLYPKAEVAVTIDFGDNRLRPVELPSGQTFDVSKIPDVEPPPPIPADEDLVEVPLVRLAWGRSGDKGDKANIGVIARKTEYLPYIWFALTEDVVAKRFEHFLSGDVERFFLPGSDSINFLLHEVLGGGGVASIRNDPQGKGYAQLLLDQPIPVPEAWGDF